MSATYGAAFQVEAILSSLMSEREISAGSSFRARPVYGFTCVSQFRANLFQFSIAESSTNTSGLKVGCQAVLSGVSVSSPRTSMRETYRSVVM